MIYTEPLFLGVTPTGARSYVADKVASLKKPFFNACAGRFSVVEAVIKAGVPPQNIHASDIDLFSSIIGYLADRSKKLDDLGIRILDPALEPNGTSDELEFAAHMLILKLNQMRQTNLRVSTCGKSCSHPAIGAARPCASNSRRWYKASPASIAKSRTFGMSSPASPKRT